MADLRISELAALAGANLAAGDLLPVADISASETKKITIQDAIGYGVTLIADATIPGAKILFNSNQIPGAAIAAGGISATQLSDSSITAAKLAAQSSTVVAASLPATGAFIGQLAFDTDDCYVYCWDGSTWQPIKASGSVNSVIGSTSGPINIVANQVGSTVTVSATLDNTSAAAQFLAGPTASAGAVGYRTIAGDDLPTATTTAKGGVVVNGNGLTMSGNTLQIDNSVTANSTTYQVAQYNSKGLITAARDITAADLPVATAGAKGAITPGSGLTVTGAGALNHTNSTTPGTYTKVTVDAQGHVSTGATLADTDIPNLPATKLTSGILDAGLLGTNTVAGAKLANYSTVKFGGAGSTTGVVTFPVAEFTGQYFFDSINGDLYLWDGNAWQAITITAGEIIYAGTFNAASPSGTGKVASVTTAGQAIGLTVNGALPAASATNNRYYLVVATGGTITTGQAPHVTLAAPDMILSNGTSWEEIDVSTSVTGATQASGITVTPAGGIQSTNVQTALEELDTEKISAAGSTITGELLIGTSGSLVFEGATANAFETTLAVTDPTADRTITLPDRSGTVITDADTGTVTNTMLAGSIALSKLVSLSSGNIIVGNNSSVPTAVAVSGDVTLSTAGVIDIAAGAIVNADINASANIAFSKLATMTSATVLVGNASNVATPVALSGDVSITNTGVTTVVTGTTSTAGKVQLTNSTSSTSTTTAATPAAVKSAYDLATAAMPKAGGAFTGDITLNAQSDLRFADSDSSNYIALQAPATVAANVTFTLPATDGTANQVLTTDGSGTLSWSTPSAGGVTLGTVLALS